MYQSQKTKLRNKLSGTIVDYFHDVQGLVIIEPIEEILNLNETHAINLEGGSAIINMNDLTFTSLAYLPDKQEAWRKENYGYFKATVSQLTNRFADKCKTGLK